MSSAEDSEIGNYLPEHIVLHSLIQSVNDIHSDKTNIERLKVLSKLVKNVLLIGKNYNLLGLVDQLVANEIIFEDDHTLFMDPLSLTDLSTYMMREIGATLMYSDKHSEVTKEVEMYYELMKELIENKTFLQEIIPAFLDYLFKGPTKELPDDCLLDLYLILSEEYRQMLEERDIENLAVLGQRTVLLIINKVYDRIDEHDKLQKIDKGLLTKYMRKFFFTIHQTVEYLIPK